MNKLSSEKRTQILNLLVEGNTLRTTSRIADLLFDTIATLFIEAGIAFAEYQDRIFRTRHAGGFNVTKFGASSASQSTRLTPGLHRMAPACLDLRRYRRKIVPSWHFGDRTSETASIFVAGLAARLTSRVRIATDRHRLNLVAVEELFVPGVDDAILLKLYRGAPEGTPKHDGTAGRDGAVKLSIEEEHGPNHVSISYAERLNLAMRVNMWRFPQLTMHSSKRSKTTPFQSLSTICTTIFVVFIRCYGDTSDGCGSD